MAPPVADCRVACRHATRAAGRDILDDALSFAIRAYASGTQETYLCAARNTLSGVGDAVQLDVVMASSPELEGLPWLSWAVGMWAGGARRVAGRLPEGFRASDGHRSRVSTTVQSISLAGEPEKRAGTGRHKVEGRVQDGGSRA